jgi:hypothetical protein
MARPARFDLDAVARAGLDIVREQGWVSLTLTSTAHGLGVTPMALYRVVADADELRRVVANHAGRPLLPHPVAALVDELHTWAVHAHAQLRQLQGLAAYVIGEWTELPAWLDIVETFLRHAAVEGIEGSEAVHTVNAVFAFVLARCQLRDSISPQRRLAPVRSRTYPYIRANLRQFRTAQTEGAFRFGLDALTAGLRVTSASHALSR